MAFGHKKNNGLDLSGVGRKSMNLPGGDPKSRKGLQFGNERGRRGHSPGRVGGSSRKGDYVRSSSGASKIPRKTIALIVVVVIAALALATAVGAFVYQMTVRNALRVDLNMDALSQVLVEPEDSSDDYWATLVKTDASSAEAGRGGLTDVALVRVDLDDQSISFLWIPVDTRVYLDGYGEMTLQQAFGLEGDAGQGDALVVTAVERLASVDVSHYAELNDAGLNRMKETLAPLDVDANTADAPTLASSVCRKMFGTSSEGVSSMASLFITCMSTDITEQEAQTLFEGLHGIDAAHIYQANAPVEQKNDGGTTYSEINTDSWRTIVTRTSNGMSPVATQNELASYESMRTGATVTIWNGVGVSGVGADCEEELKRIGWDVIDTGNAAQFVYDETLVIYKDTNDEDLAELLASDMRQGRVVRSAARYNYTGTLLVVIGKDYQPY